MMFYFLYSWRNLLRCFCCLFLHVVILCTLPFVFFCCFSLVFWFFCALRSTQHSFQCVFEVSSQAHCLVPWSRPCTYFSTPPYPITAKYLIKHWDNFTNFERSYLHHVIWQFLEINFSVKLSRWYRVQNNNDHPVLFLELKATGIFARDGD
jgi:hypothetical protein